jgi:hypothetical protein
MLRDYDCVELVRTEPRRGALQHLYKATARPNLDAGQWRTLPPGLRRELAGETIADLVGASCLQRDKLASSGLSHYFDVVVVSGDLGVVKPDASIFIDACSRLGVQPADAIMIGDSRTRDIDGALGAGLRAVWLNRSETARAEHGPRYTEISSLTALPALLTS